ncbi:HemK2/MTQ2 family protein methyltransferase [Streptomyces sp. BA2]|uniref:HemK2/MTQ2 family protein methyltransferase n=1 Tax=Streptomyces sp. BA2 TaxID=436595 RepID=UPI0013225C4C|nr:HemK2/MTQ2 family protein methyltransferase [Streptomyces sp. BA2]MWA08953.1 methyltransferase [Streptomyces sp. BA2]
MVADTAAGAAPGRLMTLPGVYTPQDDTELLARALCREDIGTGTDVLDLGTGSGALAVHAARLGARVTAVDIAWRAVLTARLNAVAARQRITVLKGDLTAAVPGRSYDFVASNPPYVPSPSRRLPRRGAARSWDAGQDGRAVVDRICDAAPEALRPGGVLLMVHSALCGTEDTLRRLSKAGLETSVADRALIPLGPVLRSRLAFLRGQGLLGDEDMEELVVIRAERT